MCWPRNQWSRKSPRSPIPIGRIHFRVRMARSELLPRLLITGDLRNYRLSPHNRCGYAFAFRLAIEKISIPANSSVRLRVGPPGGGGSGGGSGSKVGGGGRVEMSCCSIETRPTLFVPDNELLRLVIPGSGVFTRSIIDLPPLKPWQSIEYLGVRCERPVYRSFSMGLNGRSIDISHNSPRHCLRGSLN